ncbi:hypothetical protein [Dankookia sp. P2]|uniref:hypothetical protein n=1 Tax=Dankookia sp. P2 TaxID=3423955 RepID=UPI003D677365
MSDNPSVQLINRVRERYLQQEGVEKLKELNPNDPGRFNAATAHSQPLKYGFALMLQDIDANGGEHARAYAFRDATRDAFNFARYLDRITEYLNEVEIASIRESLRRDLGDNLDFSSTTLEVWTYFRFLTQETYFASIRLAGSAGTCRLDARGRRTISSAKLSDMGSAAWRRVMRSCCREQWGEWSALGQALGCTAVTSAIG